MRLSWVVCALVVSVLSACNDSEPAPFTVDAGALKLRVTASPWRLQFFDVDGNAVLSEFTDAGAGPTGTLALFLGPPPEGNGQQPTLTHIERGLPATPEARDAGWVHATELLEERMENDAWVGTVATSDSARTLEVRAAAESDGVIALTIAALQSDGVQALAVSFGAEAEERFVGFGERGNAVDQRGRALEHYVADGPYIDDDYGLIGVVLPQWGYRWRDDATYFPIPWLLSSRGYGVLLDNDELSYHRVGSETPEAWSVEVEAAEMRLRVFAGPTPAEALRRYTEALGRQPDDYAPWFFGPWLQSDADTRIDEFREADIPTSVTATYLHYLPCGSQLGREEAQRERTQALNARGTAVHTYFNPMICIDYEPAFSMSESMDALVKNQSSETYVYQYFTSRSFDVAQFDFTALNGVAAYKALTDEALSHGYEGWMEDFGEYTPLDAVAADGTTGTALHNRYARDYHCGVFEATADAGKPLARFARSGWTGSLACTPIVWGGDPTTHFGFDGLVSSMHQALSIGTSGVALWGSDIGGFFALGDLAVTDELLARWTAFGGLSVVMRSQRDGIAIPEKPRPQPWDDGHRVIWRRYAKLHTQLYPYLQAAAEHYYATGMPIMRHHVLTHPADTDATDRDDQYMFGSDLLVAPVYVEGAIERELYLPEGTWADWWRSVEYSENDGSFSLGAATLLDGGATATLPAPIEEIPMLVRAGAVIPMLAPDVFTLASHGTDPSIVHLADREDQLYLLAFPRGQSAGAMFDTDSYATEEVDGAWTLSVEMARGRSIHLEASMQTLSAPFEPCEVALDDNDLSDAQWSYDQATGVLTVDYRTRAGTLRITGC